MLDSGLVCGRHAGSSLAWLPSFRTTICLANSGMPTFTEPHHALIMSSQSQAQLGTGLASQAKLHQQNLRLYTNKCHHHQSRHPVALSVMSVPSCNHCRPALEGWGMNTLAHVLRRTVHSKHRLRGTRALCLLRPMFFLAFFALLPLAAALDNESLALPLGPSTRHQFHWTHIGLCITILLVIGQSFVAFSGKLLEPSMGITSILWLMMRNDAAISPKLSWM
jgi:hypothetical protein